MRERMKNEEKEETGWPILDCRAGRLFHRPFWPTSSPAVIPDMPPTDSVGPEAIPNQAKIVKPMIFQCPVCKSENVQRLPIAYESGLATLNSTFDSTMNSKSSGGGIGIGISRGNVTPMIGIGRGKTHGTSHGTSQGISQTALSRRVSPPEPCSIKGAGIIWVLIMLMSFLVDQPLRSWIVGVSGIILAAGVIWHGWTVYAPAKSRWDSSFICLRCGNVFEQKPGSASPEAISNSVGPVKSKPSQKIPLPGKLVLGLIVMLALVWIIHSGNNKNDHSTKPVPRSVSSPAEVGVILPKDQPGMVISTAPLTVPSSGDALGQKGVDSTRLIRVYSNEKCSYYIPEHTIKSNLTGAYSRNGNFHVPLYEQFNQVIKQDLISSLKRGISNGSIIQPANSQGNPDLVKYQVFDVTLDQNTKVVSLKETIFLDESGTTIATHQANEAFVLDSKKYQTLSSAIHGVMVILDEAKNGQGINYQPSGTENTAPLRQGEIPPQSASSSKLPVPVSIEAEMLKGPNDIPESQKTFKDVVHKYKEIYNTKEESSMRTRRKQALGNLIGTHMEVKDWIGVVSVNQPENGVLYINIDGKVTICTGPVEGGIPIPKGSPLYNQAANLKEGDRVVFSGVFFPSDTDYVREMSRTEWGSMTDPEFLMRFTSIRLIPRPQIRITAEQLMQQYRFGGYIDSDPDPHFKGKELVVTGTISVIQNLSHRDSFLGMDISSYVKVFGLQTSSPTGGFVGFSFDDQHAKGDSIALNAMGIKPPYYNVPETKPRPGDLPDLHSGQRVTMIGTDIGEVDGNISLKGTEIIVNGISVYGPRKGQSINYGLSGNENTAPIRYEGEISPPSASADKPPIPANTQRSVSNQSRASQLYYESVRNAIKQKLQLPDRNVGNLEMTVLFEVGRDGQVLSLQIEKPSGNSLFDEAVVGAIRRAEIPAMPPTMNRSKQRLRLRFRPQGVS
jgi:TonB family protein